MLGHCDRRRVHIHEERVYRRSVPRHLELLELLADEASDVEFTRCGFNYYLNLL